jgi:hypothetical protein
LFLSSYTLEPFTGGPSGSEELAKQNEGVSAKNASRTRGQRVGFAILCASFIVQAMSIPLSTSCWLTNFLDSAGNISQHYGRLKQLLSLLSRPAHGRRPKRL